MDGSVVSLIFVASEASVNSLLTDASDVSFIISFKEIIVLNIKAIAGEKK
jgi:hypothetical protein